MPKTITIKSINKIKLKNYLERDDQCLQAAAYPHTKLRQFIE